MKISFPLHINGINYIFPIVVTNWYMFITPFSTSIIKEGNTIGTSAFHVNQDALTCFIRRFMLNDVLEPLDSLFLRF